MGTINRSKSMISMLFAAIASGLLLNDTTKVSKSRRELHFALGGGNAEFHPKRTKRKGIYIQSGTTQ